MDIVALIRMYESLPVEGRRAVLTAAAEAIAAQRIQGLTNSEGEALDVQDWLEALARDTFPHGAEAARLVSEASSQVLDSDEVFFMDGMLGTALGPSDEEVKLGSELLTSYESVVSSAAVGWAMRSAEDCLGVSVDRSEFRVFDEDTGWQLDKQAWQDENYRQCVLVCAEFVATWRSDFFDALVNGTQPSLAGED